MPRPSWTWPRPAGDADETTRAAFDALLADALQHGPDRAIDYRLAAPRWQFLCHLGDGGQVLMHGSGRGDIAVFEARQSNDVGAFGAQRGVYASDDGIWPLFFAVVDRDRYTATLVNACVRYGDPPEPRYFFSLDAEQLAQRPWREGWVYLLPPTTFVAERLDDDASGPVASAQLFSPEPVVPLARLAVTPADFPFLADVHGHDDTELHRRAALDPGGFPWLSDATGPGR